MEKKFVIAGIFLVLIIVSGLWLSCTGRPLNVLYPDGPQIDRGCRGCVAGHYPLPA